MSFRQVHASLWRERWFEALSPPAKLLFLYLVTNGNTSPAGFLLVSPERLHWETGLDLSAQATALRELNSRVCLWSDVNLWWIKRFWKWQGSGPKWSKAVQEDIARQPPLARDAFYVEYPIHTLSIPYPYPIHTVAIPIGETETEERLKRIETEEEKKKTPPLPPMASPISFEGWLKKISEDKNIVGVLGELIKATYGIEPDHPRLGKLLKGTYKGDAGFLAKNLWLAAAYRPAGDIYSYVEKMVSPEKSQRGAYTGLKGEVDGS